MLLAMALYSGALVLSAQLNAPQADTLRGNAIQRAGTLHRSTKLHNRNPNHRLNHPGNAAAHVSSSFHDPSRVLNFHADGIRRGGSSLGSSASCIVSSQTAHGLDTLCYYNCHGHRRSVQIKSTQNCPHTMPESAF